MDNYPTLRKQESTFAQVDLISTLKGLVAVSWNDLVGSKKDNFSFMEKFSFPELEEMETNLRAAGEYKDDEISEILAGLKTLPEYRE